MYIKNIFRRALGSCIILLLISIHTGLSIVSNGAPIFPYGVAVMISLLIFYLAKRSLPLKFYLYSSALIAAFTAHAVITGLSVGDIAASMRSLAALCSAYFVGASLYAALLDRGDRLGNGLLYLVLFLLVGAFLELQLPLIRTASDEFRLAVNGWREIYSADVRDVANYGGYRPRFFATEPSALAFTISAALLLWICTRARVGVGAFSIIVVSFALGFFIVRSPVLILGLIVTSFVCLLSSVPARSFGGMQSVIGTITIACIVIIEGLFATGSLHMTSDVNYLTTGSFFIRQTGPTMVALEVFENHPLAGLGMGSSDFMLRVIQSIYSENHIYEMYPYMKEVVDPKNLVSNAFDEFWIFLGLGFGSIVVILIIVVLRSCGTRGVFFIAASWALLCFGLAGVNTPQVWVVLFALAGGTMFSASSSSFVRPVFRSAFDVDEGRVEEGDEPFAAYGGKGEPGTKRFTPFADGH